MDINLEDKIKEKVLEKIGNGGRGDWDVPHTLCAVKWVKRLAEERGVDDKVLASAMYFHDSCYPSFKAGYDFEESQRMKKEHAKRGAEFARKTLEEVGNFSEEEIDEVYRLVLNHDQHKNIKDDDLNRQLVFEADGLAQLDWDDCPPNFDKENCLKWIKKYFEIERPMEFWKTDLGRKNIQELKRKAELYWQNKE